MTRQPRRVSSRTSTRPIPLPAPVRTTLLPWNCIVYKGEILLQLTFTSRHGRSDQAGPAHHMGRLHVSARVLKLPGVALLHAVPAPCQLWLMYDSIVLLSLMLQ